MYTVIRQIFRGKENHYKSSSHRLPPKLRLTAQNHKVRLFILDPYYRMRALRGETSLLSSDIDEKLVRPQAFKLYI